MQLPIIILLYVKLLQFAVASLTVDNITKVMELVTADRIKMIWERLSIPELLVKLISENFPQ